MDQKPEAATPAQEKRAVNAWAFLLWFFAFVLLYVLSAGPVVMLTNSRRVSRNNRFVNSVYLPLEWVYHNTPLRRPLAMYFHLWDPKHFDKYGNGR